MITKSLFYPRVRQKLNLSNCWLKFTVKVYNYKFKFTIQHSICIVTIYNYIIFFKNTFLIFVSILIHLFFTCACIVLNSCIDQVLERKIFEAFPTWLHVCRHYLRFFYNGVSVQINGFVYYLNF